MFQQLAIKYRVIAPDRHCTTTFFSPITFFIGVLKWSLRTLLLSKKRDSSKRNRSLNLSVRNGSSVWFQWGCSPEFQLWYFIGKQKKERGREKSRWKFPPGLADLSWPQLLSAGVSVSLLHMRTYLISQKDLGANMRYGMQKGFRGAKPDGPVSDGDTGGGLTWLFKSSLVSMWVGLAGIQPSSATQRSSSSSPPLIGLGTGHHVISSPHLSLVHFSHILKPGIFINWLASWLIFNLPNNCVPQFKFNFFSINTQSKTS